MTNIQKLTKAKALKKTAKLTKAQKDALNALSAGEIKVLIKVFNTVPSFKPMNFKKAGGGIF